MTPTSVTSGFSGGGVKSIGFAITATIGGGGRREAEKKGTLARRVQDLDRHA